MTVVGDDLGSDARTDDAGTGDIVPFRRPRRERSRVSRMIGRWPEGIRFEDAPVPREGFFRGCARDVPGVWPESSLSLNVGIARGR
jgi:hypothetical protein